MEFPAATYKSKGETPDLVIARLERIHPGITKFMGQLAAPSTLARLTSSACPKPPEQDPKPQIVAVVNHSGHPWRVLEPDGHSETIAAGSWDRFRLAAGQSLKLQDGACLVGRGEPALAVIEKR